ncbi:LPS sulfotransferase NodH [Aliiroseovarius halocynthiae]|uniref:Sulfotransferase n=1 Tax=Aliiroseovarius halocynthiae TaxID=985055 RepID=A0A545SZK2_9RHOB|nr:Stf0 family sulfotransferase [Aliiroseovarius halocynthiae]TQV70408.1 sulfotransferase [Aliiroseovarius halocynthiae]SMR81876.1 LPS sulfotransferase NodH [Aliiroseovarius halocynthiae]
MPRLNFESYVICTSPRSGSTLLCKLLAATRVTGNPGSLFHKPSIDAWLKYYKLEATAFPSRKATLDAIFDAAKARGRGETDVFGLRLQRGSFAFFMDQLDFLYPDAQTDVERVEAAFGRTLFIHLTREDKLDQAISCIRAEQTGLWHLGADGTELERQEVRREDRYDADAIRTQLSEFAEFDKEWRSWFDEQSIKPLEVSYDLLAQAPQRVLADVLIALGADASIANDVPTPTAKLADETNRDWRTRFELEIT